MTSPRLSALSWTGTPAAAAAAEGRAWVPARAQGALLAGSVIALLAVLALVPQTAVAPRDAELVRLMRAMALVKGAMLAAALGALGWRLRRPVSSPLAVGYLGTAWAAAAALGTMWRMAAPGATALVLHGAGVVLLVLAARDRDFFPAAKR